MACVAYLFRAVKRRLPMPAVESIEAVAGLGFSGCAHARQNSGARYFWWIKKLSMRCSFIRELSAKISPPKPERKRLAMGEQLRIGPVLLQVSAVCTPCDQLEKVSPGLRREMYAGGACFAESSKRVIRVGEAIRRVASAA